MSSPISLLLLKRTIVEEIRVRARAAGDADVAGYEVHCQPSIEFELQKRVDTQEFRIELRLTMKWEKHVPSPLQTIVVAIGGEFGFSRVVTDDELKTYIPTLGIANLLGIIRGLVANTTALFPKGSFVMPLFDVHRLIKNSTSVAVDKAGKVLAEPELPGGTE